MVAQISSQNESEDCYIGRYIWSRNNRHCYSFLSVNQSPLITQQPGGFQPTRQRSESTPERHLPTEHSKSANLPDAYLTDEENLDTPVG